jgi:hypothetical protein
MKRPRKPLKASPAELEALEKARKAEKKKLAARELEDRVAKARQRAFDLGLQLRPTTVGELSAGLCWCIDENRGGVAAREILTLAEVERRLQRASDLKE